MSLKRTFTIYIPVILIIIISITPFLWTVVTSLKPAEEIHTAQINYIPLNPTLEHYRNLLGRTNFAKQFWNSVVVSGGTTILCLMIAFTASYSFSRFNFFGSKILKNFLLVSQMFPKVLLIIPLFVIMQTLNLLNSRTSLVVSYTSFTIPFVVWMLIGYFQSIPKELDEAAMIDGCTRLGALYRVILPLALPGVAATAIYTFIYGWNELIFAVMFVSSKEMFTLPVGINAFIGEYNIAWGMLTAAGVITALPIMILFMFLQKYLVEGLTAGAVKQ